MTPAELGEMAKGIANLQKLLEQKSSTFSDEEVQSVIELLRHKESLIEFAKYQEARGLLVAKWRGIVISSAALLTAVLFLWDKIAPYLKMVVPK